MYILVRLSLLNYIFRQVRKIVKSHYYLRHVFPSVRPSVPMQHLCSHLTDFHEILYLNTSRKSVQKIQDSLHEDQCTFLIYLAQFFSE